ncbi:ureidoglycine aminohydrolase [Vigna unguiculata]|uniref:Ureidoglycine aminohydrolase n=1 Tax=Vigna unguiculata TaxID=3917 RepID=A0A4D6KYI4_VIGUN|nr:ureidoglycine aminohydrolase [Vigna unguiculata]
MRSIFALLFILGLFKHAFSEEGYCSAPSGLSTEAKSKPLYWKVDNPTLSPVHLIDLPGFTRSVYKTTHALISPESHVYGPLPDWYS